MSPSATITSLLGSVAPLVLTSAALHALWNFLLRRAGGGTLIVALSKVAEAALLLPAWILVTASSGPVPRVGQLPVVAVGAALVLANYLALSAAYRRSDLSLAYPVARGGVFLFLPLFGFLAFGERLDTAGWTALALIIAGIAILPLGALTLRSARDSLAHLRTGASAFALIAALATASYTVWDKYAVQGMDAFQYFYGYTVLLAAWFLGTIVRAPVGAAADAWKKHPAAIILIGLLNAASYMLVLHALRDGGPTQVLAVRQLSIPFGVLLGWHFLRERVNTPRAIGAAMITAGALLSAL